MQPHDAVLLVRGEEDPAQRIFGPAAVQVDAVGGIGARQLHRRDAAVAPGRLLHGHLGKGFGREELRKLEPRPLAQRAAQRRELGRGV